MSILYNAKVKVKFLGTLIIAVLGMIIVGVLGVVSMGKINESNDVIYSNNYVSSMAIQVVNNGLTDVRRNLLYIVNEKYSNSIDSYIKEVEKNDDVCLAEMAKYKTLIADEEDAALYADLESYISQYITERDKAIGYAKAGNFEEADLYNTQKAVQLAVKAQDAIDALLDYNTIMAEKSVADATDTYDVSVMETIAVAVIATAISIVLGIMMSGIITKPLVAVGEVAEKIANGDLTVKLAKKHLKQKDEIGILANHIDKMRDGLIETVSGIKNASNDLGEQVTSTNQTLGVLNDRISDTSAATEELSASMEETGASAEEMNATAVEIENAVETVAEKAEDGAAKSGEIHKRATELGKNVHTSINKSNEIFNEIKVKLQEALEESKAVDEINALADAILGITSQTTLLALNASIEAARAGEAGRGFAVVANEISALADNSKNTVTQIQNITKIVMNAVSNLASSSNNLLNFVATDVMNDYQDMAETAKSYTDDAVYVSDLTNDLSATAEELLASVQMLMRAITEVSSASQEGAKTTTTVAEQTNDISISASTIIDNMKQTNETSDNLVSLVNKFNL